MSGRERTKRFTLTGKNMPEWVYDKLEEKSERKEATAYIVGLMEKEAMFNRIIEQMGNLSLLNGINDKLDAILGGNIEVSAPTVTFTKKEEVKVEPEKEERLPEAVPEGDIHISEEVESVGIDEDDFGGGPDF